MISILKNNKVQTILALLTVLLFGYFVIYKSIDTPDFLAIFKYRDNIIKGYQNTLIISLLSLVLSTIIGIILYAMDVSKIYYLKALSTIFTYIMLGTPLLVFIISLWGGG